MNFLSTFPRMAHWQIKALAKDRPKVRTIRVYAATYHVILQEASSFAMVSL